MKKLELVKIKIGGEDTNETYVDGTLQLLCDAVNELKEGKDTVLNEQTNNCPCGENTCDGIHPKRKKFTNLLMWKLSNNLDGDLGQWVLEFPNKQEAEAARDYLLSLDK
jgi:hypothetical protein